MMNKNNDAWWVSLGVESSLMEKTCEELLDANIHDFKTWSEKTTLKGYLNFAYYLARCKQHLIEREKTPDPKETGFGLEISINVTHLDVNKQRVSCVWQTPDCVCVKHSFPSLCSYVVHGKQEGCLVKPFGFEKWWSFPSVDSLAEHMGRVENAPFISVGSANQYSSFSRAVVKKAASFYFDVVRKLVDSNPVENIVSKSKTAEHIPATIIVCDAEVLEAWKLELTLRPDSKFVVSKKFEKKLEHANFQAFICESFDSRLSFKRAFCFGDKKIGTHGITWSFSENDIRAINDPFEEEVIPVSIPEHLVSQCCVCFDDNVFGNMFGCGHDLCFSCLDEWRKNSTFCPMCRAKITLMPNEKKKKRFEELVAELKNGETYFATRLFSERVGVPRSNSNVHCRDVCFAVGEDLDDVRAQRKIRTRKMKIYIF